MNLNRLKKAGLSLLCLAALFCFSRHVSAQVPSANVYARIDQLREAGDYQQALILLEQLQDQDSNNADILWRLSRTRVDIGELDPSNDLQEMLYRLAMDDAGEAIKADSMNAQSFLAMAVAAGRVGLLSGTREKVRLSRVVKKNVDRAIELDPGDDTAYHVRGRWHYEVDDLGFFARTVVKVVYGGLPKASFEDAASDFEHAIEIKDKIVHRLELGRAYLKVGRKSDAIETFETVLSMPEIDPDDPGHKEEARRLLEEIR